MARRKYIREEIRLPGVLAQLITIRASRMGLSTEEFIEYALVRYIDDQITRKDAAREAATAAGVTSATGSLTGGR
jgi:hypothetical protein